MLFRCRHGRFFHSATLSLAMLASAPALSIEEKPSATPARTNRLAKETSPYLKLHAKNPVDWFPWGPEALEKARVENKPIFLSIGYSSCFWCHVMERKVFENPEIAAYMNEHFVNIKVDREERPDLDDLYMLSLQVYLQATGAGEGGGWPLSMFLTPEGKPIAGGTYFPPEDIPGRPGFPGILKRVHEIWGQQEKQVRGSADVLAREVQRLSGPAPLSVAKAPSLELVDAAIRELLESRDPEHGGFGFSAESPNRPKFPQPSKLLLLAHHAERKDVGEALDQTLERMARGGLYDHLAGGFHRYSTDRQWLVPHFEKMLYDNSQLAEIYALEARRTGRDDFRRVAHETLQFVLRDLCDAHGGFYSALDAETNGVEGAYYVWSPEEVQKVLVNDAPLFAAAFGIDQPTTFEHGHVLHRVKSNEELAKAFGGTADEVASRLAAARQRLLDVRKARPALLRDDKVIVAWNGQMIRSLAVCGKLLDEPGYTAAAERAAMFILTQMRDPEGRLKRTYCEGQASNAACLDDYAFLIDGLVALNEVTGDDKWLNAARRLMDDEIEQFWDDRSGGFFYTADHHEPLLARMKDGYDSVMPSGNSVSVDVLGRLARVTKSNAYQGRAEKTLATFGSQIEQS
ncbi:MAG TPA: thioredoxin domain-containing protein, partial [Caulifigura sp.]|nr:thioredoxin domain-containing protein [Caulifigura sp.]